MKDWTETGVTIESETTKEFNKLKKLLFGYKLEDRTVDNWNYLRENYQQDYSPKVIAMLDASGYITKWLKGE